MLATLTALFLIFIELSVLAFGGGNTVLPEMQRQIVDVHHWMTSADFSALFALSQAAPGPNLMIVVLIGWHVAGWKGALVSSIAKFGPSSVITAAVLGLWERFRFSPWRAAVQRSLFPVTAGVVMASAVVITRASVHTWTLAAVVAVTVVIAVSSRVHPLWLLAAGALFGLTGWGMG